MRFLTFITLFFIVIAGFVFIHLNSFDYKKKQSDLRDYSLKSYVNPSLIFKSKDYKEFVYVK